MRPDFSRVTAREFNVGVRGHDRQTTLLGLEPDGAKIGGAGFGRNDGGGFLQAFDDLLFVYSKFHMLSLNIIKVCSFVRNS